ncbi:MAG TPA: hypothetical protein GXX19_11975 [Syntrophomonadaceae bacterium]|nr:hypothetical protein [Syntrophomonadaceae bacterium]
MLESPVIFQRWLAAIYRLRFTGKLPEQGKTGPVEAGYLWWRMLVCG